MEISDTHPDATTWRVHPRFFRVGRLLYGACVPSFPVIELFEEIFFWPLFFA